MAKKRPHSDPNSEVQNKSTTKVGKVELVGDISPKPNRSLARREQIPVREPRVARIFTILRDDETMATIQDLAENGASLSTIDAKLMYPPNTMSGLLEKGKIAKDDKDPYLKFYMLFRSWVAEARGHAELMMAKKSPEKWLDRNSSNKVLESEEDAQLALNAPSNPKIVASSGVDLSTVQKALEILREQGADLNEAIDKGEFKLFLNGPNDKDQEDED